MKTLLRILCWTPVIGPFFEFIHIGFYKKSYLSNGNDRAMYFGSLAYHCIWPIAITVFVFKFL